MKSYKAIILFVMLLTVGIDTPAHCQDQAGRVE